jgi:hypothetical protein
MKKMKRFIQDVANCKECPNVIRVDFDDVGFGWPTYSCKAIIVEETVRAFRGHMITNKIPKVLPMEYKIGDPIPIPDWCPLPERR